MDPNLNRIRNLIECLKTIDSPTLSYAIETLGLQPRNAGFTPMDFMRGPEFSVEQLKGRFIE
jgi:hypothetical protein